MVEFPFAALMERNGMPGRNLVARELAEPWGNGALRAERSKRVRSKGVHHVEEDVGP